MSIALLTATLMVFVRDVMNIVGVILQLLFWATPIFWDPAMIAGTKFRWLLLSPFNYVLQGYRDSLFGGIFFWAKPQATLVFWAFTLLLSLFSVVLYKRTRPHFVDVL
jgi:ABC-type polysaccharide/polyol phosphate export permease